MSGFNIEIGLPHIEYEGIKKVYDFNELFSSLFPNTSDKCLFVMNGETIALIYKYDIADYIEDFLNMLAILIEEKEGTELFTFASNDFYMQWKIKWNEGNLEIVTNMGLDYENIKVNPIIISKKIFLKKWIPLLDLISDILNKSDIEIEMSDNLELFWETRNLVYEL